MDEFFLTWFQGFEWVGGELASIGRVAREPSHTVITSNINVLDFLETSGGYEETLNQTDIIVADNVAASVAVRYRSGLGFYCQPVSVVKRLQSMAVLLVS